MTELDTKLERSLALMDGAELMTLEG